jgi:BAG domain
MSSTSSSLTAPLKAASSQLQSLVPDSLQPYLSTFASNVQDIYGAIPKSTRDYFLTLIDDPTSPEGLATGFITLLTISVLAMSRWGLWGRGREPPAISDEDYAYIKPFETSSAHKPHHSRTPSKDDDIITVKYGKISYPLHFSPFSIVDGLTVGAIRLKAASETGIGDPYRVKLLWKGKQLKVDERMCREEGLRSGAELLCIGSNEELYPIPSNTSESIADDDSDSDEEEGNGKQPSRKRNRGKKGKKAAKVKKMLGAGSSEPASGANSGTSTPLSQGQTFANAKTAIDKVNALTSQFHTDFLPLATHFIQQPPAEPAKRDFEYKKLSETLLQQIMLKADGVELEGDQEARAVRKALIKEVQDTLNRLDVVAGKGN